MQGQPQMAPFEAVAKAFSQLYYATFDSNRAAVSKLYGENSMMTFEDAKVQGRQNIHNKLTEGIKFRTSRHRVQTLDAQPCPVNGVIVVVGGEILVDEEEKPLRFSEVFNLQPMPDNPAFVLHFEFIF